jgi:hypothetical protein
MPSINLRTDVTRGRSDGYIYGMLRNGRGLMPNYNRIEEMDRWDVVNYVRALQAGTAAIGPLGRPGEGGTTLPGYTRLGPTRPVPYYKPRRDNVGQERNVLGDPAPGNDVGAPAQPGGASPLPDTTGRVQARDTVGGSTSPHTSAPRTGGATTTSPMAPANPAAGGRRTP